MSGRVLLYYFLVLEEIMARKKVSTTVYITQEQSEKLKLLHKKTKVPVAEYIREGIDMVLDKHKSQLPGQISFGEER
jgi:hypothetical protein